MNYTRDPFLSELFRVNLLPRKLVYLCDCWRLPLWLRYINDAFTAVHWDEIDDVHEHLNKQNADLQFTMDNRKTGWETGWRNPFQRRGKMWCHIMESHSTFYIRCVARLIFPRVFHYLCLQLYRLPMFWFKRMKRTCSWRRQLEGTKPVEAKDRVNDYETCDSEKWLQNYGTYSVIMRMPQFHP